MHLQARDGFASTMARIKTCTQPLTAACAVAVMIAESAVVATYLGTRRV